MLLINCEINQTTTCLANCFIIADPVDSEVPTFAITDTKLYVPVVTLSTEDNAKLLQQFKSSYKSTINWNKYQSKVSIERWNQYLDYLIDQSFQGLRKLFLLLLNQLDQPVKMIWEDMIIFKKLQLVKEMIYLFQKTLQDDSNRFKETTRTWCWSKSNTTNHFYWISTHGSRYDNVFHYWRIERNFFRLFTRNCERIVNFALT